MFLTILLSPLLWVQESRESCGRLSYNHTFPIALGIQFQEVEHLSHHFHRFSLVGAMRPGMDFHWFSWISIDFHRFSLVGAMRPGIDFHWFSWISIDFHRFSLVGAMRPGMDFHWFS